MDNWGYCNSNIGSNSIGLEKCEDLRERYLTYFNGGLSTNRAYLVVFPDKND